MAFETVLIVDENDELRETLQDLLQEVGLAVCGKRTMGEALRLLRSESSVQLALIDLYPLNSNNLKQVIDLREEFSEIIVIGMSGSLEPENQAKAEICRIHALVHKPFDIKDVLNIYKKYSIPSP